MREPAGGTGAGECEVGPASPRPPALQPQPSTELVAAVQHCSFLGSVAGQLHSLSRISLFLPAPPAHACAGSTLSSSPGLFRLVLGAGASRLTPLVRRTSSTLPLVRAHPGSARLGQCTSSSFQLFLPASTRSRSTPALSSSTLLFQPIPVHSGSIQLAPARRRAPHPISRPSFVPRLLPARRPTPETNPAASG